MVDATIQVLERALHHLAANPNLGRLHRYCSKEGFPPIILGEYSVVDSEENQSPAKRRLRDPFADLAGPGNGNDNPHKSDAALQESTIWLKLEQDPVQRKPMVRSLYCCGCQYKTSASIVLYQHCDFRKGHYLVTVRGNATWKGRENGGGLDDLPVTDLDYTLRQINSAHLVEVELMKCLEDQSFVLARGVSPVIRKDGLRPDDSHYVFRMQAERVMSTSPRPEHSGDMLIGWTMSIWTLWRIVTDTTLSLFEEPLPFSIRIGALANVNPLLGTMTGSHVRQRLRRLLLLPSQVYYVEEWRRQYMPAEILSAPSLLVTSWIVHILFDLFLGCLCAIAIWCNVEYLLSSIHRCSNLLHVEVLSKEIEWLNNFPGGFKLNVPLTQRLGSIVIMVIQVYGAVVVHYLASIQAVLLKLIALGGLFGLTTMLALAYDLLRVFTVHIKFVHATFSRLYNLELSGLASLGHLFRGKKNNILRRRTDTCEYDTQQLLLGTVLFTILTFLFPTILVFYAFFSIVRGMVLLSQGAVWVLYILIRDLPVCPLVVLISNPRRLPYGIRFHLRHDLEEGRERGRPREKEAASSSRSSSVYGSPITILEHSEKMSGKGGKDHDHEEEDEGEEGEQEEELEEEDVYDVGKGEWEGEGGKAIKEGRGKGSDGIMTPKPMESPLRNRHRSEASITPKRMEEPRNHMNLWPLDPLGSPRGTVYLKIHGCVLPPANLLKVSMSYTPIFLTL